MNIPYMNSSHSAAFDNLQAPHNGTSATQQTPQYPCPDSDQAVQRPSATAPLSLGLAWPPGFAGEIARYIYDTAIRPVPEVAIVGAMGLLAGICGKSWTTPGKPTGLNLYIVLVARSAVGKEAMHDGISKLMGMATKSADMTLARQFVDFSDYVSGQALQKAAASNPSFVNVTGEFGMRLKQIAGSSKSPDSPMQNLRRVLVNLYSKSGPDSVAGGLGYSDKDKNIASVSGVAYSLIGETTPGTFYELITPDMMADGFMSRFCVVEYKGERPPKNQYAEQYSKAEPTNIITILRNLMLHSITLQQRDMTHQVICEPDGWLALESFESEADINIMKAGDDESKRQMWNRAYLKALKLASLLATSQNPLNPVITTVQAQWAIDFIRRDIASFSGKLDEGDIGDSDDILEKKILAIAKEYLETPWHELPKSAAGMSLCHNYNIIARKYIQTKTANVAAFRNNRNGATKAMDLAISSLVKSGYFAEVPKIEVHKKCDFHGQAYRVLDLPGFSRPEPKHWMDKVIDDANNKTP